MPASATADTSASAPPAGNNVQLKLHVVKDQEISSGGEWKGLFILIIVNIYMSNQKIDI